VEQQYHHEEGLRALRYLAKRIQPDRVMGIDLGDWGWTRWTSTFDGRRSDEIVGIEII
jgi:hypothetical protein